MSVRLVITADDLGRDRGTNETIAALLADRLVTATTLLSVARAAEHAVDLLTGTGTRPAVHAALTSDAGHRWPPLSGATELGGVDGRLPGSAADLASVPPAVVRTELAAQWAWAVEHGVAPLRLDSHGGTLYGLDGPSFLAEAITFCAEHGIGFRLPRSLHPYPGAVPETLATGHARAVEEADRLGVALPDSLVTHPGNTRQIGDYRALRAHYLAAVAGLGPGTHELILHPSLDPPAVPADAAEWPKRVWEHRLLRDPAWQDALAELEIDLVDAW